jgi:hypothetical protein
MSIIKTIIAIIFIIPFLHVTGTIAASFKNIEYAKIGGYEIPAHKIACIGSRVSQATQAMTRAEISIVKRIIRELNGGRI